MTKQYNLHSVRIEDEVWARVKSSGVSVNQLLRKALELTWTETRRVVSKAVDDEVIRDTVIRSAVSPKPGRAPLLKPSQR